MKINVVNYTADDVAELSWSLKDVCDVRPDLNVDQARQVIKTVAEEADASVGVNWDTLEGIAEQAFGPERELSDHEADLLNEEFKAALANEPQIAVEVNDEDILSVTYPNNIQVILDHGEDNEISVRVWKLGDDQPLGTLTVKYDSCKGCDGTFEDADLDVNGNCPNCR